MNAFYQRSNRDRQAVCATQATELACLNRPAPRLVLIALEVCNHAR